MLFSSLTFIYIFLPVLCLYYFLAKSDNIRRIILTAFSLIFYAWGEPIFVLLMLGSVLVNFIAGKFISKTDSEVRRKAYLIVSVAADLIVLAAFKYIPLFVNTINLIPSVNIPIPEISLPIGISFYTFQALSYTVDVYRRDVPPCKSFLSLLLYVSFFPQLIAGPIVRYKDIAEQIPVRKANTDEIFDGICRFSVGLAKKTLLANPCGSAADALLLSAQSNSAVSGLWIGVIFFSLQIYFDFSGYSDMAIGLGRIFGFSFRENFDYPYVSKSATEFWRRWHISLGTFFRDYVYIPLGGNRSHWLRNVFIVWLLTGLWHGASWNFVLWGLYYALLLLFEKKILFGLFEKLPKAFSTVLSYIYTVFITLIGWTVFYYTDFDSLLATLSGMFGLSDLPITDIFVSSIIAENAILLAVSVFFALPIAKKIMMKLYCKVGENASSVIKTVLVIVSFFLSTAVLSADSYNPFLYFRF